MYSFSEPDLDRHIVAFYLAYTCDSDTSKRQNLQQCNESVLHSAAKIPVTNVSIRPS